jgi:hypothetical protein
MNNDFNWFKSVVDIQAPEDWEYVRESLEHHAGMDNMSDAWACAWEACDEDYPASKVKQEFAGVPMLPTLSALEEKSLHCWSGYWMTVETGSQKATNIAFLEPDDAKFPEVAPTKFKPRVIGALYASSSAGRPSDGTELVLLIVPGPPHFREHPYIVVHVHCCLRMNLRSDGTEYYVYDTKSVIHLLNRDPGGGRLRRLPIRVRGRGCG